jgi:hypothetical protein
MERPDQLSKRVDEAAATLRSKISRSSPQCGFASTAEGKPHHRSRQWAKLKLVADTARKSGASNCPNREETQQADANFKRHISELISVALYLQN